jgi:hypothetical protein
MAELKPLNTIARQFRASLAMFGQAIELCPGSLWTDETYPNRFWHIAYHTLFYTHLYLQPTQAEFRPWTRHQENSQYLGQRPGTIEELPRLQTTYSKADVREYLEICRNEVEERVPALNLDAASGFSWLPFDKLEVQFYNIRHLQHHTGQLADRLRTRQNLGITWLRPE